MDPDILDAWRAYRLFRRGHMPAGGGTQSQARAFLDVVDFLDPLWSRHDDALRRQAEAEARRGRR